MNKVKHKTLTQKAVEAMKVAINGVIVDHQRRQQPLAVWQDGKVVLIHPRSALVAHEGSEPYGTKTKRE